MRWVAVLLLAYALSAACLTGMAAPEAVAAPARSESTLGCTPAESWRQSRFGAAAARMARDVVTRVNVIRAGHGLPRLVYSAALARSARWKSLHMAYYHYLAHSDLGKRDFATRIHTCGYPAGSGVGENISYGYAAKDVVSAWMDSPGHRENILDPRWRTTGVAIALTPATGVPYFTQEFGESVAG